MICNEAHREAEIFESLPEDQGGAGRHKCAGCAYERGFCDGLNNIPSRFASIVSSLPDSQAGTVRHKDPEAAYDLGYKEGSRRFNMQR